MATDVEKNCDQIVLEDGVQRLGFTADLIGRARKRMTEEGYGGLLWISTIFDKRQKRYTLVWFGFSGAPEGFAVLYGKVRNGKLAALSKTLCDLGNPQEARPGPEAVATDGGEGVRHHHLLVSQELRILPNLQVCSSSSTLPTWSLTSI